MKNEKGSALFKDLGELFMVGISQASLDDELTEYLLKIQPGSLILTLKFFNDMKEKFPIDQGDKAGKLLYVREFIKKLGDLLPGVLIGVDHEGGFIQNFGPLEGLSLLPPQRSFSKIKEENPEGNWKQIGEIMGRELVSIGVHWSFGPVLDTSTAPKYHFRRSGRTYSDDPQEVLKIGLQVIEGMEDMGLISTAKHYPSMGNSSADSHRDLPIINSTEKEFQEIDLVPFAGVIKHGRCRSIMTNHAIYKNIDPNHCATYSKKIMHDILRTELKFNGIVITDDLGMKGCSTPVKRQDQSNGDTGKEKKQKAEEQKKFTAFEKCTQALLAGCDILMFSFSIDVVLPAMEELSRSLSSNQQLKTRVIESIERVRSMKEEHFNFVKNNTHLLKYDPEDHKKIIAKFPMDFNKNIKTTVGMDCTQEDKAKKKCVLM